MLQQLSGGKYDTVNKAFPKKKHCLRKHVFSIKDIWTVHADTVKISLTAIRL